MNAMRHKGIAVAVAAVLTVAHPFAQAQPAFPTKPIRLLVPFSVGGQPESVARILAPRLAELWKQPVVVENRPGASGTIGFAMVAKAAPDGGGDAAARRAIAGGAHRLGNAAGFSSCTGIVRRAGAGENAA